MNPIRLVSALGVAIVLGLVGPEWIALIAGAGIWIALGLVTRREEPHVDLDTERVIAYADRYAEGLAAFRDADDDSDDPGAAPATA
jgi:hypothetical protein